MPSGEWAYTKKGHCSKVYYKWRERWIKKGYDVQVSVKEFYPIYLKSQFCADCKGAFGTKKRFVRSVKVRIAVGGPMVITPSDLSIIHFCCNMLGNTNAGPRKEPELY